MDRRSVGRQGKGGVAERIGAARLRRRGALRARSVAARIGAARLRRRAQPARWVVAGAAATALIAGCGDDAGDDPAPAGTVPATAPASAPMAIARPQDGSILRATRTPAGRLRARTRVQGTTTPGGPVFLSASCRPQRCDARATAGRDGRWTVAMTLTTTANARFVTIDAGSQARVEGTGSAVTTVELTVSGAGAATASGRGTAGSSGTRPRGAAGSSGTRPGGAAGSSGTRPPGAAAAPPPPPPVAQRSPALPRDVLVIGDSLAIGMADTLRASLPGWQVSVEAKISRPLATGMQILAGQGDAPAILALSLFTNDDPGQTKALERAVRATASRPGGCAVWATIVRPPYNGVSYAAANRVLERLAGDSRLNLRLVDWAGLVARSPSFIAGDGVHATPAGYRARGELFASAIRSCAGEA